MRLHNSFRPYCYISKKYLIKCLLSCLHCTEIVSKSIVQINDKILSCILKGLHITGCCCWAEPHLYIPVGWDEVVDWFAFFQSLLHLDQFLHAVNQQLNELALHTNTRKRRLGVPQHSGSRVRRSTVSCWLSRSGLLRRFATTIPLSTRQQPVVCWQLKLKKRLFVQRWTSSTNYLLSCLICLLT